MQATVKILGVDVDMMSNDVFLEKMNEYLSDDRLDVILFASTDMLNKAAEDEEYRLLIEKAELLLPGEEALLTTHHVDVLQAGGMVVSCRSLGMMLENLTKQDMTVYVIAESEAGVQKLQDYCRSIQPEICLVGSCVYDSDREDAAVVNEINSRTPNMILLDLPTGVQEQWIMAHSSLLNARLCVAIGGVAGLIFAEQKEPPAWVGKLHLEGAYSRLVREQSVKKDMKARIFRKRITQYNNNNQITEIIDDSEDNGGK